MATNDSKRADQPIKPTLTAERLRALLHYDPDTGIFTRIAPVKRRRAGEIAGYVDTHGYVKIGIDGKRYYAHRLAWLYMTGEWPPHYIDHRQFNEADNRWAVLRPADPSQNASHSRKRSDSSSKYRGICPNGHNWSARIQWRGTKIYLGTYGTQEEAAAAYQAAAIKYHGEYAHYDEP